MTGMNGKTARPLRAGPSLQSPRGRSDFRSVPGASAHRLAARSACPVGFHAHEVRLRRGSLVAGALHAPTPFRSALLAVRLTLPHGGNVVLLPTHSQSIPVLACQPLRGPPLRCAPFRPRLQGQRLRLGPARHATVAPRSLRSLVRPHHRAAHRPMSLGPGGGPARGDEGRIRREVPPHACGAVAPSLSFVHSENSQCWTSTTLTASIPAASPSPP